MEVCDVKNFMHSQLLKPIFCPRTVVKLK